MKFIKLMLLINVFFLASISNSLADKSITEAAQEAVEKASEFKLKNENLTKEILASEQVNKDLTARNLAQQREVNTLKNTVTSLEGRINNASMEPPHMVCRGERRERMPNYAQIAPGGCGDPNHNISTTCGSRKIAQRQLYSVGGGRCGYTCIIYTCLNI